MQTVMIYKEKKESKLGVTFYRKDPQEGGQEHAAIVSRLAQNAVSEGKLQPGERIMSIQGMAVQNPLHAARLLRESEGYLRIGKLPKRDDFDANYARYAEVEAENARKAMEAALPGQAPQATPRTDAATPRGPNAATTPLLTGLRVINQPGTPGSSSDNKVEGLKLAIDTAGANIQAMQQQVAQATGEKVQEFQQNIGNLSARAGSFFANLAASLPTENNKRNKAALRIQRVFRAFSARGQFHEERGAVLMLQAASRRKKAQEELNEKKMQKQDWAARGIQGSGKRMLRAKKAKAKHAQEAEEAAAAAAAKSSGGGGIMGKLSRSLSFSKRNR